MSVIVGYSVPAASLELSTLLHETDSIRIDLERVTEMDGSIVRYFWVHEGNPEEFQARLEASDIIASIEMLDVLEHSFLCRVTPQVNSAGLAEPIHDQDAVLLEASGTADYWQGRIRFHTEEGATAFQQACRDRGIPLTVTDVHDLREPEGTGLAGEVSLTPAQREALSLAYERGYFDVPRRATVVELSEEIGVSDQAISERLRRAQANLARAVVGSDPATHAR